MWGYVLVRPSDGPFGFILSQGLGQGGCPKRPRPERLRAVIGTVYFSVPILEIFVLLVDGASPDGVATGCTALATSTFSFMGSPEPLLHCLLPSALSAAKKKGPAFAGPGLGFTHFKRHK